MTRCLLIDDNGRSRQQLQQILSGLGLETVFTGGGDDALRVCNDNAPDVVLVSASVKGVPPREFMKRLRLNGRGKAPVVFLYAETADTALFGETILEGAADVLMLPFDRDLLQFKLRQAGLTV